MVIAGLDIATTTGIACLDGERYVFAREYRWDGKTSGQIFRSFRKTLYTLIEKHEIRHVGAEQPLRTDIELGTGETDPETGDEIKTRPPMKTFQRIYGLCAIAEEVCAAKEVPFVYVNQMTWRKSFTGKARATKDDSLGFARLIDKNINSRDAAEALGVAWWLRGHIDPKYAAPRGDIFEAGLINPKAPNTPTKEYPF